MVSGLDEHIFQAIEHLQEGKRAMNTIHRKVSQVVRRQFLQNLVTRLPWFLFGLLLIAAIAIAVPKFLYWSWLDADNHENLWNQSWIWGSAGLGLALTLLSCWFSRIGQRQAAEQLDHRFDLQARTSSALTSNDQNADPAFRQALLSDAEKRVSDLVVSEKFPIQSRWPLLLPAIPMLLLFGLTLLPRAATPESELPVAMDEADKKQLAELIKKASNKEKKEDNAEVEKEMDATRIVQQAMEKAEQEITKKDASKKDAMVAINDVKKAIEDQQNKIGQAKALKDRLSQMKEQTQGPADKMSKAMQKGDFEEAADQVAKLAEKLAKGDLSKEDTEKLAKQMEDMKNQMQELQKEFEKKKQDLDRQIQDAAAEGDMQRAAELQKQKEDLEKQQRQMNQLGEIAKQGEKIAEALKEAQKNGGELNEQQKQDLQDALQKMQEQMQEMEMDAKQMQELQDMMDKMEQMKQNMKNGKMPGNFGDGNDEGEEGEPGEGMGKGQGKGFRPTNDDGDGNFYGSQVNPDVKKGEVARIGKVGGANRKGTTAEFEASLKEAAENSDLSPDDLQSIPYNQREHVRDYFKKLRDN